MAKNQSHQAFMSFVSKSTNLISDYSLSELRSFARSAKKGFPSVAPVIEAYLKMAEQDGHQEKKKSSLKSIETKNSRKGTSKEMHLFDLFRSKKLFPTNSDLSDFASRILPKMTNKRFDKMSRADIAGRVIEYLETLNGDKRNRLEVAMRKAIVRTSRGEGKQQQSFFSHWEKIIKGIEL